MRIAKACAVGLLSAIFMWPVSAGTSPWTPPLPPSKPSLSDEGLTAAKAEAVAVSLRPDNANFSVKTEWSDALGYWRTGNYENCHKAFAALAKNESSNEWARSGAAFWAARAADRMKERRLAKGYLQLAAQNPQTFYGQLARQILRDKPEAATGKFPILSGDLRKIMAANPALVHAIIMQESRFNGKARSSAGARGLMQLMPNTAKHIDKGGYKSPEQLFDEAYNVKLGSRYIKILADQPSIGDNPHLMLAAYNNGPYNLERWLKKAPEDVRADPLLTIEMYPTSETRAFIERVMANMWVYERMLNKRNSPSLEKIAAIF